MCTGDIYTPRRQGEEDSYHQPVTGPRVRLRGCRCQVPCLPYTCISSHHRGSRLTPWCCGATDDDLPPRDPADERDVGRCDDCWWKREKTRQRRGRA